MISIPTAGGYDKLQYKDIPEPGYTQSATIKLRDVSDEDCVIIDTYATGVNYADSVIRWGLYKSAKEYVGWPITPGFEISGTIKSVGANVKDLSVGDKVAGLTLFGGYSRCVKTEATFVRKLPENLSLSQGASFLVTGATAYYAVHECCKLRPGEKVLVHSAAGGVGGMLVQMLRNLKCHVTGVVGSPHKVETVKQLGCDEVIDKSVTNLWTKAKEISKDGYKAIFDANGIETLQESYNHLASGGRLITYGAATLLPKSTATSNGAIGMFEWLKIGLNAKRSPQFNPLNMSSDNKSVMAFNLSFMTGEREIMTEFLDHLFDWLANEKIRAPQITEYSLEKVADAHRDLESGKTVGKLVLLTQAMTKSNQSDDAEKNEGDNKIGENPGTGLQDVVLNDEENKEN